MNRLFILFLSVVVVVALLPLQACGGTPEKPKTLPRAAIVDQLYLLELNPELIAKAREMLKTAGFEVDLWQGKDITVDFYRQLTGYGYKVIVLRVHSGILLSVKESQLEASRTSYLFTGETYSKSKYVTEQLTDKVSNALMSEKYPLVFAVNSRFITEDAKAGLKDTLILAMGCESQYLDDMAEAFMQKGASAYIGWSSVVSLEHTDKSTLNLLSHLCNENLSVEEGVAKTMAEVGADPYYKSYLKLYPLSRGKQTIKELAR